MRRKGFFILLVSTLVLLFASTAAGFIQTLSDYFTYGESFQVKTIIAGVETVETVSLADRLLGVFFVLWIDLVLATCLIIIYYPNSFLNKEVRVDSSISSSS